MSIPGVLRGVIASSLKKPSDGLRAPNALTTGEELPPVFVRTPEVERAEAGVEFLENEVALALDGAARVSATTEVVLALDGAVRIALITECLLVKDP